MTKKIKIEHSSLEEPLDVEVITTGDLEKWGNIETAAIMKIAEALNDRE